MSPPSFPVGKHEDCVDALGLVGQLLDRMLLGAAARGVETAGVATIPNTWTIRWDEKT
jgi:hypothetical protein